jgi:hypothetical protein
MVSASRYFRVIFKISIVMAIIAATFDAISTRQNYLSELERHQKLTEDDQAFRIIFDCAIRLTDQQLEYLRNDYGNYDVARLGCGIGDDGKTFFVSDSELASHKAGTFLPLRDFVTVSVDLNSILITLLAVLTAVNAIGAILYLSFLLFNWIFK